MMIIHDDLYLPRWFPGYTYFLAGSYLGPDGISKQQVVDCLGILHSESSTGINRKGNYRFLQLIVKANAYTAALRDTNLGSIEIEIGDGEFNIETAIRSAIATYDQLRKNGRDVLA